MGSYTYPQQPPLPIDADPSNAAAMHAALLQANQQRYPATRQDPMDFNLYDDATNQRMLQQYVKGSRDLSQEYVAPGVLSAQNDPTQTKGVLTNDPGMEDYAVQHPDSSTLGNGLRNWFGWMTGNGF